jgi:hypothetical protein
MRIRELLEGKFFHETDFVHQDGNKREINYDLVEDLMHFMHQDDDIYRRLTYPSIAKCIDRIESKKPTSLSFFKPAVESSYKAYVKKFPIKELSNELEEELCERVCNKMHQEVIKDIKDGKYKD